MSNISSTPHLYASEPRQRRTSAAAANERMGDASPEDGRSSQELSSTVDSDEAELARLGVSACLRHLCNACRQSPDGCSRQGGM